MRFAIGDAIVDIIVDIHGGGFEPIFIDALV